MNDALLTIALVLAALVAACTTVTINADNGATVTNTINRPVAVDTPISLTPDGLGL